MNREELLARRLTAHGFAGGLADPDAVVARLTAVQAQDLHGALWAIAQRTATPSAAAVREALDAGALLRTHALRPTWHILGRGDLDWVQRATGPRVEKAVGTQYRAFGLDDDEFLRSDEVLRRALDTARTRPELTAALQDAGVDTADPVRVQHLLIHAEVTGLITSGPVRDGKQTYALVTDRTRGVAAVPADPLTELARRYLAGHGPATSRDFAWWSGLTLSAARAAIDAISGELTHDRFGSDDVWSIPGPGGGEVDDVLLLSNYDEFVVGYADRSTLFGDVVMADNPVFRNVIAARGTLVGTWSPKADDLAPELFGPADRTALADAVERYRVYRDATPRA